mmetsp:Transcript_6220/g.14368  ORF Transcript_6220/g.14368 Transcript_6220/m.14368 type:complete len:120 (+) Transcript_6220:331-690(+)
MAISESKPGPGVQNGILPPDLRDLRDDETGLVVRESNEDPHLQDVEEGNLLTLKAAKFDKCLLIGIKGNFKIDNFAKKKFDELVSQIPANFSKVLNDSTRHVVLVSKHMSLFHCSETDN